MEDIREAVKLKWVLIMLNRYKKGNIDTEWWNKIMGYYSETLDQ